MKKCQQCDKEFTPKPNTKGKFCSRSCAAKVNNSLFPKRVKNTYQNICIRCSKEFGAGTRRKYCSRDCSSKYRAEEYIVRWKLGEETGSQKNGEVNPRVRKFLLDEANYRCTRCGWGEVNQSLGKVVLTIDHIDGNWKNNSIDNLVVLCYNCHTLTPTFGALNKGNANSGRSIGSRRH